MNQMQIVWSASANIAPAPKKAEQPAIPLFTPASQIGKLADSLNIVIGEADFIRQDGQIEIWQYQQPDCVVDFYVPLGDSEKNHISGWDMRPRILEASLISSFVRLNLQTARRKGWSVFVPIIFRQSYP